MRNPGRILVAGALAIMMIVQPAGAFAAIKGRIVENVGVKTAKLWLRDTTDAKRIGGAYKKQKDSSYAGQLVWCFLFGTRSGGKYPVEMYSNASHKVFTFVINTSKLVTKNGTHVGTTESALVSRYGSRLKKSTGPVYTDYWMGKRSGRTDFYVRNGKVHHITIERY